MATYPRCQDCGADLTSQEEQEQGYCQGCLTAIESYEAEQEARKGEVDGASGS